MLYVLMVLYMLEMVTINKDFLNKHSLDILMFIIKNQIKKP